MYMSSFAYYLVFSFDVLIIDFKTIIAYDVVTLRVYLQKSWMTTFRPPKIWREKKRVLNHKTSILSNQP